MVRQLLLILVRTGYSNSTNWVCCAGVFADKARKDAKKDQLCNHGCGDLSHAVAQAWGAGHLQLMTEGQRMRRLGLGMRALGTIFEASKLRRVPGSP